MSTKKSETSKCEHELILKLHNKNKSYLEIAKLLNRSKSTIHYIIEKSKTEGNITNRTFKKVNAQRGENDYT